MIGLYEAYSLCFLGDARTAANTQDTFALLVDQGGTPTPITCFAVFLSILSSFAVHACINDGARDEMPYVV